MFQTHRAAGRTSHAQDRGFQTSTSVYNRQYMLHRDSPKRHSFILRIKTFMNEYFLLEHFFAHSLLSAGTQQSSPRPGSREVLMLFAPGPPLSPVPESQSQPGLWGEGADGLGSRARVLALGPPAFHCEGLLPVCNPQPAAQHGFGGREASKPRDPCLPLRKASRIFHPSLFHLFPLSSHWRW